jgi:hypothetical protein
MKKVVKTLVIHPDDRSTDFLKPIYENVPNKTVITGRVSKYDVIKLMETHDRIMMMGHGSPGGLFNRNFTFCNGFIIDDTMVPLLKEKNDNVYIWCDADQFVRRHNLKGFFSGMFVSEVGEAYYMRVKEPNQRMVDESNDTFSEIVSRHITKKPKEMYEQVKQEYGVLADTNPVASYNLKRLFLV